MSKKFFKNSHFVGLLIVLSCITILGLVFIGLPTPSEPTKSISTFIQQNPWINQQQLSQTGTGDVISIEVSKPGTFPLDGVKDLSGLGSRQIAAVSRIDLTEVFNNFSIFIQSFPILSTEKITIPESGEEAFIVQLADN